MNSSLMLPAHGTAPWIWPLREREAATLQAATVARWLRVEDGWLWVTPQQAGVHGQDVWLTAGDSMALPAGTAWVVEAWPQARVSLLLDAPAEGFSRRGGGPAPSRSAGGWLSALASVLAGRWTSWWRPRVA